MIEKLDKYHTSSTYTIIDKINEIIDFLNGQSAVQTNIPTVNPHEWISIDDRLPEEEDSVLVYQGAFIGDLMHVYTYMGDNLWADEYGNYCRTDDEGITHWMPLPTPPAEKEN